MLKMSLIPLIESISTLSIPMQLEHQSGIPMWAGINELNRASVCRPRNSSQPNQLVQMVNTSSSILGVMLSASQAPAASTLPAIIHGPVWWDRQRWSSQHLQLHSHISSQTGNPWRHLKHLILPCHFIYFSLSPSPIPSFLSLSVLG